MLHHLFLMGYHCDVMLTLLAVLILEIAGRLPDPYLMVRVLVSPEPELLPIVMPPVPKPADGEAIVLVAVNMEA